MKGLTAKPVWDKSIFPWVTLLEESFPKIKQEFLDLRNVYKSKEDMGDTNGPFQHYRSPIVGNHCDENENEKLVDEYGALSTDKGDWNVCYLYLHGLDFKENLDRCPETAKIISSIKRQYHHSFFSALAPDTHIMPHFGPTNKKLRCHLPLCIPKTDSSLDPKQTSEAWLRIANQTVVLEEGKCVVFDDSFRHESGNSSINQPRIVLIIDVWHPDFTDEEVHFMKFINNAQIKAAQKLAKRQVVDGDSDNLSGKINEEVYNDFFSIIQNSRSHGISETDLTKIWTNCM